MEKICEQCSKPFHAVMTKAGWSRYCSKPCHAASQRKRIIVACARCGKLIEKTPRKVTERNYCSRTCAAADHGATFRGEKHPGWRGGMLSGRGPSWPVARAKAIKDAGERCADCGMTRKEHRAEYGKDLHVHHRSPYRLSLDNSQDNLIVLCIPCHTKEEVAQRQNLSPADFEIMRQRSERDRALGLDHDDKARHYDACPQCGARKARKSILCLACRTAEKNTNRPEHFRCPVCGGWKTRAESAMCRACHLIETRQKRAEARKTNPHLTCPLCGGKKSRGNDKCWSCRQAKAQCACGHSSLRA